MVKASIAAREEHGGYAGFVGQESVRRVSGKANFSNRSNVAIYSTYIQR